MSPYFNKGLLLLLALLGTACSGVRPGSETPATVAARDDGRAVTVEPLPRDYDSALQLMRGGEYKAAIPVLEAFIDARPDLAGPRLNLAIALRLTGDRKAAAAAIQRALELNPDSAAAWHQRAILYRAAGEFEAALDAYRKALALDPDYALAHRNIGILYDIYLQQPGPALEHYRKYLALHRGEDATVSRWVVDLERRSGNAQARLTP